MDAVWALVSELAVAHMNVPWKPQWGSDYPLRIDFEGGPGWGELYLAVDDDGPSLGCVCLNGRSPQVRPPALEDAGPPLISTGWPPWTPRPSSWALGRATLRLLLWVRGPPGGSSPRLDLPTARTTGCAP